MGRKKLEPLLFTWHYIESSDESRLYRDCVVKRARSRKYRTKTGQKNESVWWANIFCPEEKLRPIIEEAKSLCEKIETGVLPPLKKPKFQKQEWEILREEADKKLRNKFLLFTLELKKFNKNKDEHWADINKSSKSLWQEITENCTEGRTVYALLKDESERFIRSVGKRFGITSFYFSGEYSITPFSLNTLSLEDCKWISLIIQEDELGIDSEE